MACRNAYKTKNIIEEVDVAKTSISEPVVAKSVTRLFLDDDSKITINDLLRNNFEELEWIIHNKIYTTVHLETAAKGKLIDCLKKIRELSDECISLLNRNDEHIELEADTVENVINRFIEETGFHYEGVEGEDTSDVYLIAAAQYFDKKDGKPW
jgi:hypothetical protein